MGKASGIDTTELKAWDKRMTMAALEGSPAKTPLLKFLIKLFKPNGAWLLVFLLIAHPSKIPLHIRKRRELRKTRDRLSSMARQVITPSYAHSWEIIREVENGKRYRVR